MSIPDIQTDLNIDEIPLSLMTKIHIKMYHKRIGYAQANEGRVDMAQNPSTETG